MAGIYRMMALLPLAEERVSGHGERVTLTDAPTDTRRLTRRLVPAQALYTLGMSVDLTLTGIVGHHLAPTPALATVPFSLIPIVAAASTFALSRWIGRRGYRRVFTFAAAVAVPAGLTSALAVQLHQFWLFCVGTALIGVYQAGAGYYRYAAAESNPAERARAVSTVLAGGLVAAIVGPFLATAIGETTGTPYVASYLLVALAGAAAAVWNATMPRELADLARPGTTTADDLPARSRAELWRPPGSLPRSARRCGRSSQP
jgi:MFS family permease